MVRWSGRRRRVADAFEEFHASASAALSAARGVDEAAVRGFVDAMAEMWLRKDGLEAARDHPELSSVVANPQLAELVGRLAAEREKEVAAWLRTGPAALAELTAAAAPDSAADDPDGWLGQAGKVESTGVVPGLWRIGTGTVGAGPLQKGSAPFPVAVPLLDESHLQLVSTPRSRDAAEALVELLVMRVLSYFRPGLVQVHVWDVGRFTGALPGLYPLTRTGLLTVHDPSRLPHLLDTISDRIRRVHTRTLVDGRASVRAQAEATGTRSDPWVVAVLVGNREPLPDEEHRQLQRVARGGIACGIQLVLLDVPVLVQAAVESIRFRDDGTVISSMTGPYVTVTPDPVPSLADLTAAGNAITDAHETWRLRVGTFADLLPPTRGALRSAAGLHAPIGFADGIPVEIALADASPHALVGGPSGTGKTNLLLAMISSLAARYPPDELEFYLLDFKEGVSFAQFAPGRVDRTWLPHARLVGVNMNTDREFGLALLQFLADEMRRRAEAAKDHEVTKLEELRAADPQGRWPRIVAVVDEFQYLFAERDAVTREATALLEDVARRGRSQGIHLVLASQDVSGIEAFWGRPAIFEQFVLRIALPRARRVLSELNDATLDLPRWHAVVNHESGIRHGNEIVHIPDATAKGTTDEVQRLLHGDHVVGVPEQAGPRLFDGSRAPRFADLLGGLPAHDGPQALVGQCIDVEGRPALVRLPDGPGRNIGVLAGGAADALRVLGAAAGSLAGQYPPGSVDVVVAPLVAEAVEPAQDLVRRFVAAGHAPQTVPLDGIRSRIEAVAAEVTARLAGSERRPLLLVLYAADAADAVLDREGTDALRRVLRSGPETGVHVLGWWRSVARLRATLSVTAAPEDVSCWVALDVQGSELASLNPAMLLHWSPRPGRGLFFDRAQHVRPEVVIVPSLEEEP